MYTSFFVSKQRNLFRVRTNLKMKLRKIVIHQINYLTSQSPFSVRKLTRKLESSFQQEIGELVTITLEEVAREQVGDPHFISIRSKFRNGDQIPFSIDSAPYVGFFVVQLIHVRGLFFLYLYEIFLSDMAIQSKPLIIQEEKDV